MRHRSPNRVLVDFDGEKVGGSDDKVAEKFGVAHAPTVALFAFRRRVVVFGDGGGNGVFGGDGIRIVGGRGLLRLLRRVVGAELGHFGLFTRGLVGWLVRSLRDFKRVRYLVVEDLCGTVWIAVSADGVLFELPEFFP